MPIVKLSDSSLLISKLKSYAKEVPVNDETELEFLFYKAARSNPEYFSRTLRNARLKIRYSQTWIANKLNVRQATYSEWENGKYIPKITHLLKIVNILEIDPADLIDENPLQTIKDCFIPLVDNSYFKPVDLEHFVSFMNSIKNKYPSVPVLVYDFLSFAYRITDSSMYGGEKPIFENSILLFSIMELDTGIENQFLYCDNKICIVTIDDHEPIIRLLKYDNNVLSLIPFNPKWPSYSFPDGKEYLKNIDDPKCCLYNGKETFSNSIHIRGILKKMYVDF